MVNYCARKVFHIGASDLHKIQKSNQEKELVLHRLFYRKYRIDTLYVALYIFCCSIWKMFDSYFKNFKNFTKFQDDFVIQNQSTCNPQAIQFFKLVAGNNLLIHNFPVSFLDLVKTPENQRFFVDFQKY